MPREVGWLDKYMRDVPGGQELAERVVGESLQLAEDMWSGKIRFNRYL